MQISKSRREFIKLSAWGFGTAVLSFGISACEDNLSDNVEFTHGLASGDPLEDRVILWTRAAPKPDHWHETVRVGWEVSLDPHFASIVNSGTMETTSERDFTIKIDAAGLRAGTPYYYRFKSKNRTSVTGRTRTLAGDDAKQIKLAVVSCSNFPAGLFHVYREIANRTDIEAVLHVGDYIYEYQRGGYASEHASALGREVLPAYELLNLNDYRTRYAQYRSDADLQAIHQNHPFIAVWDDHEITNNSWNEGADNHQPEEGSFETRKMQALQAYGEWLPIRPKTPAETIFRTFRFGRLVALHMLDTRIVGRDRPLNFEDYFDSNGFSAERFFSDTFDSSRSLLGTEQRDWLRSQFSNQDAVWQVLGQQVVMGRMYLPGALATQQISMVGFVRLVRLAGLAAQGQVLSPEDQTFLTDNQKLLKLPALPFNLDAWDGFEAERQAIFQVAKDSASNLVVLAGDSHNAWANDLVDQDKIHCGVEFAAPSVSSPGLEVYLGIKPEAVVPTEQQLTTLIENLKFVNINERGYLTVNFTEQEATAEFVFIDSVVQSTYQILEKRFKRLTVKAGEHKLNPV